MYLQS